VVRLEVVTLDRMLAFEVEVAKYPYCLRELYRLVASFWNEYAEETVERGRLGGRRARHAAGG
jgi:hypothetical protein